MASELTPELLADYESPRELKMSPSGSHVVYALRSFWVRKPKQENITASYGLPGSAKAFSSATDIWEANDTSPQFSPDGKYISFVSDRAKPGKGGALYIMPTEGGGEGLPLTSTENEKSVAEYKWSPDGKKIAFTSADEKTEEKKKKDDDKDDAKVWGEDWEYNRLRILNVESKEVKTVVKIDAHVGCFDWNDEGTRIVFQERDTPEFNDYISGCRVKVVDISNSEISSLCSLGVSTSSMTWVSRYVYWGMDADERPATGRSIMRFEVDGGDSKPQIVLNGEEDCPIEIELCGKQLIVYVQHGLVDQLKILDGGTIFEENIDISRGWGVFAKEGKIVIAVIKAIDIAMPLEVFSVIDGQSCQLSNHSEALAKMDLGKTSNLYCKAADGTPLEGILSIPSALSTKKGPYPAILHPHGGPYFRINRGSDGAFGFEFFFLAQGYAVLQPNYRGGCGRGKKFAQAVAGDAGASYSDCIDLLKKAISDGIIDEKRVAVSGWSQGGFLSYLCPTRDSTFHFAASIPGAGVSDWTTMAFTSDIPAYETVLTGGAPWMCEANDTRGRKSSAIWHMQNIRTPFLILHGEKDQRCPVEQAVAFHRGLKARGKECEMVIYPREGHGYPVPWERLHYIDMLKRMKTFLAKHLK